MSMQLLLIGATGAAAGLLGAILGTGGGVFLIPVLVLALQFKMHNAVATSLVSVIATSIAVAGTNTTRGAANLRLGMTLETATALGAIVGGLGAAYVSATALEVVFAVVMVPVAVLMWRGRPEEEDVLTGSSGAPPSPPAESGQSDPSGPGPLDGAYVDPAAGGLVSYRVRRLWSGLSVSFAAGGLSGLLGIGGGVFKVPALHLLCAVPVKAAAATSNFMIGITAAASAFIYFGRGDMLPDATAAAVLGVVGGSIAGAYWSRAIGGSFVRRLFAVLLVAVACQMIFRAVVEGA